MQASPILSPGGEPVFTVGGPNAWQTHQYRSLNVSLEWAKQKRKYVRMLCIWPSTALTVPGAVSAGTWAISQFAMVDFLDWNEKTGRMTGKPSDDLFREAKEALPMLGRDKNDKNALFELVDCVMKYGPMLALMPVAPAEVKRRLADEAMWEFEAKNKATGKVIKQEER